MKIEVLRSDNVRHEYNVSEIEGTDNKLYVGFTGGVPSKYKSVDEYIEFIIEIARINKTYPFE